MAFPYSGITPKPPSRLGKRRPPELIIGGAASVSSARKLRVGEFATLVLNSATPVSILWSGDPTAAALITDVEYQPGDKISWEVDDESTDVAVIATDGVTPFKAWLYVSS